MAGMSEVGRLFNDNELIVAEVLQSAEAMKAAVDYLKQFMEKGTVAGKGKIVLATVKGDVHDIGKNLVEIILANNGYTVVNLGIKVPPEELIEACRAYRPDAVGLSGLLVKSARQMVVTAQDLQAAGIEVPLLVGGAALSKNFTRKQIAPAYRSLTCYAQDAMSGLALLDRIMDDERRTAVALENAPAPAEDSARGPAPVSTRRSSRVRRTRRLCRRRTPSASYATCRNSGKSGRISTRSCCSTVTWVSRATSRRRWPNATRRRWSCMP